MAFLFMLIYNILRGALLWKTKSMENYQDASGLRANFSLETSKVHLFKWRLDFLKWGQLYTAAQMGFYIAIGVALTNTFYFFTQHIPI